RRRVITGTGGQPARPARRGRVAAMRRHAHCSGMSSPARALPMTALDTTNELFFDRAGLDPVRLEASVAESLAGADDGELFLEYRQSESLAWDDGRLKSA